MTGMVHIYEGDGKGKTTAAVGLAVRCAGNGKKVLFTQFLKDGSSGEIQVLKQIEHITVFSAAKKFGFTFRMTKEQKQKAAAYYKDYFRQIKMKICEEKFELLVLDEAIDACNTGILEEKELCSFLDTRPEGLEVVLTGRNPSEKLAEYGDYYSKIQKVRHPFDWGVASRCGIEK